MSAAVQDMAKDILEHRDEPIAVVGLRAQHWAVLEAVRRMGVPGAAFHPASVVYGGGGTKGTRMPADYREQVFGLYRHAAHPVGYGMSELNTPLPRCASGRYHQPPWIKVLVLDQSGEKLLNTLRARLRAGPRSLTSPSPAAGAASSPATASRCASACAKRTRWAHSRRRRDPLYRP